MGSEYITLGTHCEGVTGIRVRIPGVRGRGMKNWVYIVHDTPRKGTAGTGDILCASRREGMTGDNDSNYLPEGQYNVIER